MTFLSYARPLCFVFSAALAAAASAQETSREIKFSDPTKPGTLKVSLGVGDLRIRGADTLVATVKTDAPAPGPVYRKDGLRVLTASSGFNFTEKDNVITLDAATEFTQSTELSLTVPRSTSLVISNSLGGEISCTDVSGDIEIKNTDGRIKLEGVAGGVLVETMNGEISADIREIHVGRPLSFTSMNGEILIRLPADAKANVRLRSRNGEILTDFDEATLVTRTESVGPQRDSARSSGKKSSNNPGLQQEINAAVQEVVRASVEVAREATVVIREATIAATEAVREARGDQDFSRPFPPRPSLPPMTGGKIVTGTLNGGGPEIRAATMNGDVTLRKSAPRK